MTSHLTSAPDNGGDVPPPARRAGDAAFEIWFKTHFDRVRSISYRIVRDLAAAEDVAQEALLKAWIARGTLREEDLGAWLAVVARNLSVSYLRRAARTVPYGEMPETEDSFSDPATVAEGRETHRLVRAAFAQLDDRHRRTLYMRGVREAPYEEVGAKLGLTPEGARSVVFRARTALRERLAAVGESFSAIALGFKVRFRTLRSRLQSGAQALEGSLASAVNLGLGLLVVVGTSSFSFQPGSATSSGGTGTSSALRGPPAAMDASYVERVATLDDRSDEGQARVVRGRGRGPKVGADFEATDDPTLDLTLRVPNPLTGPETDLGGTTTWNDRGPVSSRVLPVYRDVCRRTTVCGWIDGRL